VDEAPLEQAPAERVEVEVASKIARAIEEPLERARAPAATQARPVSTYATHASSSGWNQ
jgi:hypothetical protein